MVTSISHPPPTPATSDPHANEEVMNSRNEEHALDANMDRLNINDKQIRNNSQQNIIQSKQIEKQEVEVTKVQRTSGAETNQMNKLKDDGNGSEKIRAYVNHVNGRFFRMLRKILLKKKEKLLKSKYKRRDASKEKS